MAVSYIKLWKLLLDKDLKKSDLKIMAHVSSNTLAKMGKNEYISMESMEKICLALHCNIENVFEFVESKEIKAGEIYE